MTAGAHETASAAQALAKADLRALERKAAADIFKGLECARSQLLRLCKALGMVKVGSAHGESAEEERGRGVYLEDA
jgi:hypothetical protein